MSLSRTPVTLPAPRPSDYRIDHRHITPAEASTFLRTLSGRHAENPRRIQAWFDHCARIRGHTGLLAAANESRRVADPDDDER